MNRLDRFYIFPNCPILPTPNGHIVSLDLSSTLSDYLLIFTIPSLLNSSPSSNDFPYKVNVSHLKNQDCIDDLVAIWNVESKQLQGSSIDWWGITITKCTSFLHDCRQRAWEKHHRLEKSIKRQLEHERSHLAYDPCNICLQKNVVNNENLLQKMDAYCMQDLV